MADFPGAHDWGMAFDTTFHMIFPQSELPSTPLLDEYRKTLAVIDAMFGASYPPPYPRKPADKSWEEWTETPEYQAWKGYNDLQTALDIGVVADAVAFIHLFHWPVSDPDRMAGIRLHLLEMIRLSRESWRRIAAETDDANEWVPGPHQTGILPRLQVTENRGEGWMMFLDQFEAVLTGEKLLSHWRFVDKGVNVKRIFDAPRTFDPLLMVQGTGVIPYLETGQLATFDNATTFLEVFGVGFFAYFIYFN